MNWLSARPDYVVHVHILNLSVLFSLALRWVLALIIERCVCCRHTLYVDFWPRYLARSFVINFQLFAFVYITCNLWTLVLFFSGYFLRLLYGYGIELDRFLSHANWPRADKRTSLLQVLKTFPLNIKHIFFCLRFFPFDDVLQCDEFRFGHRYGNVHLFMFKCSLDWIVFCQFAIAIN